MNLLTRTAEPKTGYERRRADSNRCSGRDGQNGLNQARPWHHGWPLFLAICALAAAPLFNRTLGQVAVGVLFALMLWTALRVRRRRPEVDYSAWGAKGRGYR